MSKAPLQRFILLTLASVFCPLVSASSYTQYLVAHAALVALPGNGVLAVLPLMGHGQVAIYVAGPTFSLQQQGDALRLLVGESCRTDQASRGCMRALAELGSLFAERGISCEWSAVSDSPGILCLTNPSAVSMLLSRIAQTDTPAPHAPFRRQRGLLIAMAGNLKYGTAITAVHRYFPGGATGELQVAELAQGAREPDEVQSLELLAATMADTGKAALSMAQAYSKGWLSRLVPDTSKAEESILHPATNRPN